METIDDANIAVRLAEAAARHPDTIAVEVPQQAGDPISKTFAELDREASRFASGLIGLGAGPGKRIALAVRPGPDFLTIVFGLFRSRATAVFIDPGMGKDNVLRCLAEVGVDGLIGIPAAQVLRRLNRRALPDCRLNVCVGRRLPGLGVRYDEVLATDPHPYEKTASEDEAAIIYTSGSTGPPKGVRYEHGMFDAQWRMIRDEYGILPGIRDVACFPLFGLFNVAMGVTTVWPPIDFAKPAKATPEQLLPSLRTADQSFASPAIWKTLAHHLRRGERLGTLRAAYSAGAPVPPETLRTITLAMPEGSRFATPYGATESLPVATIDAQTVLDETAAKTERGAGTCVGEPFAGVTVKVIRPPKRPVRSLIEVDDADVGEIGEIIVHSPSVTKEYFRRPDATAASKLDDGGRLWHRIGDAGYLDRDGRLWFCGRLAHIVPTAAGEVLPVCVEPLLSLERHRVAVVAATISGRPVAVAVVETPTKRRRRDPDPLDAVRARITAARLGDRITHLARWPGPLPVDARHNAKIRREQIAAELDPRSIIAVDGVPAT